MVTGDNVFFKGNEKEYDKDDVPHAIKARFSWFSVFIENDKLKEIDDQKGSGELGALFCQGSSRYGTNLFTAEFDEMIRAYENCCQEKAEISVLATYVYKREVMHAFVIAPTGIDRFADHPRVATRTVDERFNWNDNLWNENEKILTSPGRGIYNWTTFSTIQWDNASYGEKSKFWGHLAFAFYLDCLPNKTFVIPNDIGSWEKCGRGSPFLETKFIPDRDDANSDDDMNSENEGENLNA